MHRKIHALVYSALIAALYTVLTLLQNLLLPNSATMAIQFRVAEALCVLAFFTPAAIPGLGVGCLLANLLSGQALPLDFLVGTLASIGAAGSMWALRNRQIRGYPLAGMLMPAVWNAALVGWELTAYVGGGFRLNAAAVAAGELAVLLSLGSALYTALRARPGALKF